MENNILIGIVVVGLIVFLFSLMRNKKEAIVNFILRVVLGVLSIYVVNMILLQNGISTEVGINAYTTCAVGLLGMPGVILLYGICFF